MHNILLLSGQVFKIGIFILIIFILLIISFIRSRKSKSVENMNNKNNSIDTEVKGDAWWAARLEGLKKDYEDRESYFKNKFEQLTSDYESRESFIRGMFEEIKKDLEAEKKLTVEKQLEIDNLERKMKIVSKQLVKFELQLLRTLSRLSKTNLTPEELEILDSLETEKFDSI